MAKVCDNKSVGILVWNDGRLLMIERKKYNFGYAIPAGHQDGDDEVFTAKKELSEEVGLVADELEEKIKLQLLNPCRREGGTFHDWTIIEAVQWHGDIKPSDEEIKKFFWADQGMIQEYKKRLEEFAGRENIALDLVSLPELVKATNGIPSWKENPGLEPPIYFLFKKLKIIS